MTQTLWRFFEHGDAPALACLVRDAVMQLAAADHDMAARAAGATTLSADVSLCAARCFARAGFRAAGEEVVERNGVSLTPLRMQKPLGALPVQT